MGRLYGACNILIRGDIKSVIISPRAYFSWEDILMWHRRSHGIVLLADVVVRQYVTTAYAVQPASSAVFRACRHVNDRWCMLLIDRWRSTPVTSSTARGQPSLRWTSTAMVHRPPWHQQTTSPPSPIICLLTDTTMMRCNIIRYIPLLYLFYACLLCIRSCTAKVDKRIRRTSL